MVKSVSRETKSLKKHPIVQLFLDVSSTNTGVIIYDVANNEIRVDNIYLKDLQKPPCMDLTDFHKIKIGLIKEYFDNLQRKYKIDKVYMEGIFIQRERLKSSEILIKIQGFLMGYFINIPQFYIAPAKIKKTITGNGKATKDEVKEILEKKYNEVFSNNDISDAFALFVCTYGYIDISIKREDTIDFDFDF